MCYCKDGRMPRGARHGSYPWTVSNFHILLLLQGRGYFVLFLLLCFTFVFPVPAASQAPDIYAVDQVVEPVATVINTTGPFINNLNVPPV